jgi:hypothetical protein
MLGKSFLLDGQTTRHPLVVVMGPILLEPNLRIWPNKFVAVVYIT